MTYPGSTSVDNKQIHHTGTGRISRLKMSTMSLYESKESNGQISLKDLFEQPDLDIDGIMSDMKVEDLIFAACRGGWPSALRKKSKEAKLLVALERLFVIEDVDAWCPAIRSATTIRSGQKREFTDPSMAVAAMGLTPDYLEKDLKTFGFIFECLCIRDLKIYSQTLNGRLSYYHDRYGLEADAVLHIGDGRYALIECKLSSAEIEEGAKHLLTIRKLVQEYNEREKQVPLREPDLLMVITGGLFIEIVRKMMYDSFIRSIV